MKKTSCLFLISALLMGMISCLPQSGIEEEYLADYRREKPYTRWWWHASVFEKGDIRNQLIWLKDKGFGGVEIAFIYPVDRNPDAPRFAWLGEEWQEMLRYAKHCADSLGMGCDYTFGTLWPFGGTFVDDQDRTRVWGNPDFKQPLRLSWTHPDTGNVLNHLDKPAFERYATVMGNAIAPAMEGGRSALFCDSWEVETHYLWTPGFDSLFTERYGYDIRPVMDSIYNEENAHARYDYMKLISDLVLNAFYTPFHEKAREMKGISRAQVAGAPVDLLTAYAVLDIPETEAMLYEPAFSGIVASAAALAGKPIVSAESFTCLYGWPAHHHFEEQVADLKLVADALFANGTNFIIWHGTPFNPKGIDTIAFYATVHVGDRGKLNADLVPFNAYLSKVMQWMQRGKTYAGVAVYLPTEDKWIEGELPRELQLPWSWGAYEMRYTYFPEALTEFHPLWVNTAFLKEGKVEKEKLHINGNQFSMLYVEAAFLDLGSLKEMHRLASAGLPVVMINPPLQAGQVKHTEFEVLLEEMMAMPNVFRQIPEEMKEHRLVEGVDLPAYWCRQDEDEMILFFAHPESKGLKYPLSYGQAREDSVMYRDVILHFFGHSVPYRLSFPPNQSLLLVLNKQGEVIAQDISYFPPKPEKQDER